LVEGRLGECEELRRGGGAVGGAYWDKRRAERYAAGPGSDSTRDPLLRRLRRVTGKNTTVLDIGAGTGRFAIALAPRVAEVIAVDPSEEMLRILRRRARQQGIRNIRTVQARWEDAEVDDADVAFSSYVLTLVADAPRFVRKLDSHARRHAFLYVGAFVADAVFDPFWRRFHGRPRRPGATWLDAVAVLQEMGIEPDVEVVELPYRARFATVDEAVEDYGDQLLVPEAPEARAELARLLGDWLVRDNGSLRPPIRSMPAAILHWRPAA
jgi:SAM-dependent methyltransferase